MRYFLFLFFSILLSVANGQQNYWQQQVNYTINVQLDDVNNTLTGFEQMEYLNNSPDTLGFIYLHLWQNAYKNDRTTFSEQLLHSDRTDFYFSDDDKRGFINQLDIKVNNTPAVYETDSTHIDIIKLLLPRPLAPHSTAIISTPFFVKLPYNFSRGGHAGQSYQITQWYPKAALYDSHGWHPIPYTDQGEFYNDFGDYTVHIALPANYKVGATGLLASREETTANVLPAATDNYSSKIKKPFFPKKQVEEATMVASSRKLQTLTYTAANVTDFAWFADKRFIVKADTIQLASHTVKAFCYILPENAELYAHSMQFLKKAVHFYSNQFGDYPYPSVSVVSCPQELFRVTSMEYPMITLMCEETEMELDATIAHELGHNWLQAILATNERDHAWMDEGFNTFIERKYRQRYYPIDETKAIKGVDFSGLNGAGAHFLLNNLIALHKDQPIDLTSEAYSFNNYGAIVYEKTADWLEQLEKEIGVDAMHRVMQLYFKNYGFKHPQPADLKQVAETVTGKDLSYQFNKIYQTGWLDSSTIKKTTQLKVLIPGLDNKHHYINLSPIAGYNSYDKIMIGAVLHNYQLPLQKFQFLVAPLYATGSNKLNGAARIAVNRFTQRQWLETSVSAISYSINQFETGAISPLVLSMQRIVPSVKLTIYNKDLREKDKWILQARSFLLKEDQLDFTTITTPTDTFDVVDKKASSYLINQLAVGYENNRILYPYNARLIIDQGSKFIRAGFTGNYFFNYKNGEQGINARFFAGKFVYLTPKTFLSAYETGRYHLNLSAPKGNEDYTFSNYFIGRNAFEGFKSQQVMERDGFFKVGTDLLGNKIGKSDDWIMALNISGNIPDKYNPLSILPIAIPLKFFFDIGTYSEAWQDNAASGRFVYDAGLQLSLLKDGINVYFPLLYSKVYGDYYKSTLGDKRFWKTVSFNINLSALRPNNISRELPL